MGMQDAASELQCRFYIQNQKGMQGMGCRA